jgi:hypothetical protein
MRRKLIVAVFFCIVTNAFSQSVLSLNSLFTEQDAILVPQAEGSYNVPDLSMAISINKAGDNFYLFKYGREANPSVFEAIFVKIDDELFLDLSSKMNDTIGDDYYRGAFIKSHMLFKVRISNDSLQLSELNYTWFYDNTLSMKVPLKYEWVDNAMLLTMKTEELRNFFIEHKNDKALFKHSLASLRNPSNTWTITKNENVRSDEIPIKYSQRCIPEFPFKDGWMGGDADVSIPVSDTQTIFIFGDTYVGNKNQQNRQEPGLRMVASSTVAVETCKSDGKMDINYFWNNMYSDNPEPIFKSLTDRYRLWVMDAFKYKSYLYVLFGKVGPKRGVAPNDIFGWESLGFTLAKVFNPSELPNKWQIEFIPLPDFSDPLMSIHCHIKQNNYIYFFVTRNYYAHLLVRKNLDLIDDPDKPFEYYALDKTWKSGIRADDMDTVLYAFRGNTVNYHSDIKKWIMICDIKFMDNKIKMCSASSLTGPWSEGETIYECPEVTPGSASYSKSNYCYSARECIQNYDEKNHMMLITYDINNSNFPEIKSNPGIYTPKVIRVSLKQYSKK